MKDLARHRKWITGRRHGGKKDLSAMVEIEIDLTALFRMAGGRAILNNSGKSTMLNGVIRAKVISTDPPDA